jgi:hypothetical protein
VLSGIWIISQKYIENISIYESIKQFLKINIPIWIILLIVISIIVMILIKKSKHIEKRQPDKGELKTNTINSKPVNKIEIKINVAKPGFNSTINSDILKSNNGTYSIWAFASDIHYKIDTRRKFLYITSHATNNGNPFKNPALAVYPNAWAISRITPTESDNIGSWRFFCNGIDRNQVILESDKNLSGWHLFSITWSKNSNFIKFVIDNEIVGETNFESWPSEFSGNIYIGTWPNRAAGHYFNSKISQWYYTDKSYNEELINRILESKPE